MQNADYIERNWLFYLAQPTKLLLDIDRLTISHQLELLKQSLSQAEISERKTNLTNSENSLSDNLTLENEIVNSDDVFIESSKLFKKSKVLDIISLQIAANLKFSLNLFRIVSEMPVKLLARLYRVLIMHTAKLDKENIFTINPYGCYTWSQLNPMTIYGIMSYHIWCLHVSLSSSMLPQPFRNLTPVVSGLTEVPEVTFFADNRVEVGVVLTRIQESVNQLNEINSLLDSLNIARPFSSAFSVMDSTFSTISKLPKSEFVQEDQSPNFLSEFVLQYSKPLCKGYLSASLNFVLGRYAFQQQQFSRSQELLQLVFNEMQTQQLHYLDETGATLKLVQAYLTACLSYTPSGYITDDFSVSQSHNEFLQHFCKALERCLSEPHTCLLNPFWTQPWSLSSTIDMKSGSSVKPLTIEAHLYEILLNSLVSVSDSSDSYIPVGLGIRNKLESLCLKLLTAQHNLFVESTDTANIKSNSSKNPKQTEQLRNSRISDFEAVRQLFTKIHICNSIERLISNSMELPFTLTTELLLNIPRTNLELLTRKEHTVSPIIYIDTIKGREFLFDCLASLLEKLSTLENSYSTHILIICQYVTFLVQEGICLLGSLLNKPIKQNSDLFSIQKNFHGLLEALISHKMMNFLPMDNRKYLQSVFEATCSISSFDNDMNCQHLCSLIPDSISDLPNPSHNPTMKLYSLNEEDLCTQGLGFWFNYEIWSPTDQTSTPFRPRSLRGSSPFSTSGDVDMRNMTHQYQFSSFLQMPILQTHFVSEHGSFTNSSLQTFSKENSLVCDVQVIRYLLLTRNVTDVNILVDYLLSSGMSPDGILELNSSWRSSLHYLASLELVGLHAVHENSAKNPIEFFLSSSGNIMWAITVLLQLAKGSSIIRHETSQLTTARAMLLASLNNLASLNPMVPSPSSLPSASPGNVASSGHIVGKKSRAVDVFHWIRAAIRHELLLADLLEFLNPSSLIDLGGNSQSSKLSHPGQVSLNDLIRRAKICLFYATGLSSNANALETKMESLNPIGLSDELVTAATCFLLMAKESNFLYPISFPTKSVSLPPGRISFRVGCAGSLDLIRILLHFYEVLQSSIESFSLQSDCIHSPSITNIQMNSDKQNLSHIKIFLAATIKFGDLDKLKTVISDFYGIIIRGWLIPAYSSMDSMNNNSTVSVSEHRNTRKYHTGASRSGISSPSLYNIVGLLGIMDEVARLITNSGFKFHFDAKCKTSDVIDYSSIGSHLLDYLIIGFAQITHQLCTKFSLHILRKIVACFSTNHTEEHKITDCVITGENPTTIITSSNSNLTVDSKSNANVRTSRWDRPKDQSADKKKDRKRNQSDKILTSQKPVVLSFLDEELWTVDLESNSPINGEVLCDHLKHFLDWSLTNQPDRIDWLILRGEIEFFEKNYRLALSTYLEYAGVVSNSFSENIISVYFPKELLFRMMCCLQYLGLFYESVILSQFESSSNDECLIDNIIQLISCLGQNSNGWPVIQVDTFSNAFVNLQNQGLEYFENISLDCLRGSCGGTFLHTTLDCPDNLISYLWNVRLLSALEYSASNRGAFSQAAKFKARLNNPEINVNNPDDILSENRCTLSLEYLRYLYNLYLV
ncbi:unnamed protein product [Heterobilharzia americana]|nr:unnamed protein product [Heterobilharzia americana]